MKDILIRFFTVFFIGTLALFPVSAFAVTTFIQLSQTGTNQTLCNHLCTENFSPTAPISLPPVSFTNPNYYISASGAVTASSISSFVTTNAAIEFDLGLNDTYTVHGAATGPFPITVNFGATGTGSTVPNGPFNVLFGGATVKIGTYSVTDLNFPANATNPAITVHYPQVSPFDAASQANSFLTLTTLGSAAINVNATYTKMVMVGDVFDIAYELILGMSLGTLDLSHTATISFLLPDDVYLTSALGATFGDVPTTPGDTPIPAALPLFATGLGALGLLGWRRKRKAEAVA